MKHKKLKYALILCSTAMLVGCSSSTVEEQKQEEQKTEKKAIKKFDLNTEVIQYIQDRIEGNPNFGYITVPQDFYSFKEQENTRGLNMLQWGTTDSFNVITLYKINREKETLKDLSTNYETTIPKVVGSKLASVAEQKAFETSVGDFKENENMIDAIYVQSVNHNLGKEILSVVFYQNDKKEDVIILSAEGTPEKVKSLLYIFKSWRESQVN